MQKALYFSNQIDDYLGMSQLLKPTQRIALEAMAKNAEALASIEQALQSLQAVQDSITLACTWEGLDTGALASAIKSLQSTVIKIQPIYDHE